MKLVLALVVVGGCVFGQSDHCGEEYTRNMTHVKNGLYRIEGEPLAGSQQLRFQVVGENVVVTTDDGRTAQYRVQ
ncbi:MAG: hypothetical protein ABI591_10080 [Kofleriaceae bacterium]